jgi:hypothetical protein
MAGMRMATRRDTSTQKHSPSTPWVCLHISLLHRHQQCLIHLRSPPLIASLLILAVYVNAVAWYQDYMPRDRGTV